MAARHSFYDILGVTQDATPDEVRKAYKRKVLQTHPDKLALDATESQKRYAEARFREVCHAFEILNDPAKRHVYDNGLNYLRARTIHEELQAKLARERAEWARQSQQRQEERMRNMKEEIKRASEERYQETLRKADANYRERMRVMEEELRLNKENARKAAEHARKEEPQPQADSLALAEEILKQMRQMTPEWETRKQAALRRQAERTNSQDNVRFAR
ncbi:DnaJ domain-containing protein [Abortiporus biennis]|nr:DnaJ domain-containing protein [Abortiporus biennis]